MRPLNMHAVRARVDRLADVYRRGSAVPAMTLEALVAGSWAPRNEITQGDDPKWAALIGEQ